MSLFAWITVIPLAAWLYLALLRGFFWRTDVRLEPEGPPEQWPSVAVVVPARDEQEVLGATLAALLAQDYAGRAQIIIVDDQSTDGTADLAVRLGSAAEARLPLVVVSGSDTPPGWTGKLWALAQGVARAGDVDFVLLTDADIRHPQDSLSRLVSTATAHGLDQVSLMARLRAVSRAERLVVPAFVYFFAQLYPFRWVGRGRTAAAAGGCLLVRRSALERAGGLEAIRGAIIDDVTLAGALRRSGSRLWLGFADDVESVRSYGGLAELWRMVSRSAFTQLRYSAVLLAGTVIGLAFIFLVPPAAVIAGVVTGDAPLAGIGLLAWAVMTATYVPMLSYYRLPRRAALLLPVTAGLYTLMTIDSALQHWRGGVAWKGRRYVGAP
ncbi:MAG TPA: glycosyltransferase [Acidimicrobiales bacterium]|nr:glycosyltransferase [Acidimicrobiales bacterium]